MGIMPDQFWRLTPWQLGQCRASANVSDKAEHRRETAKLWNAEALRRANPLPSLADLLSGPKEPAPVAAVQIDAATIKARLRAYNKGIGK